jgi:hypothetical protein
VNPIHGLAAIGTAVALGSIHRDHRSLARRNIRLFFDQSADVDTCGGRHFQLQVLRGSYAKAKSHIESMESGPDRWTLSMELDVALKTLLDKENSFRVECVK